ISRYEKMYGKAVLSISPNDSTIFFNDSANRLFMFEVNRDLKSVYDGGFSDRELVGVKKVHVPDFPKAWFLRVHPWLTEFNIRSPSFSDSGLSKCFWKKLTPSVSSSLPLSSSLSFGPVFVSSRFSSSESENESMSSERSLVSCCPWASKSISERAIFLRFGRRSCCSVPILNVCKRTL